MACDADDTVRNELDGFDLRDQPPSGDEPSRVKRYRVLAQEGNTMHGLGVDTKRWKWVWLSPFKALAILRGPNILFIVSIL